MTPASPFGNRPRNSPSAARVAPGSPKSARTRGTPSRQAAGSTAMAKAPPVFTITTLARALPETWAAAPPLGWCTAGVRGHLVGHALLVQVPP